MKLKHRPKPEELKDPGRADKRCPRHECVFYTKDGRRLKLFDCENREETHCRASYWPWCPDGNLDRPLPPMARADWTRPAQIAWHNFMAVHQNYEPPYKPLPYTTGKDYKYAKTEEPEGYEVRVRSPRKGEERRSPPPEDSDDGLPHVAVHAFGTDTDSEPVDEYEDVLPSSPPRPLRRGEHNFLLDDSDEDANEDRHEVGDDDEDSSQIDSVDLSPKKTRSGARFAEMGRGRGRRE